MLAACEYKQNSKGGEERENWFLNLKKETVFFQGEVEVFWLCLNEINLVAPPPESSVVFFSGSQFLTVPSPLYTLLVTTDPPSVPPENHVIPLNLKILPLPPTGENVTIN